MKPSIKNKIAPSFLPSFLPWTVMKVSEVVPRERGADPGGPPLGGRAARDDAEDPRRLPRPYRVSGARRRAHRRQSPRRAGRGSARSGRHRHRRLHYLQPSLLRRRQQGLFVGQPTSEFTNELTKMDEFN